MRWALGALIVLGASAGMIAAILRVRRRAPEGGYFNDGDRAAGSRLRGVILGVGCVVFVSAASWIATFPVSLSI